jgi:hypothetical protein
MATLRHEIPTHLNVEDRAVYGLSVRQLTYLIVGSSGAYAIWSSWPDLPDELRGAAAAAAVLLAAAFAFVRPGARGLEEWALAALRYLATPKRAVWRAREPDPSAWRRDPAAWAEAEPRLSWAVDRREPA